VVIVGVALLLGGACREAGRAPPREQARETPGQAAPLARVAAIQEELAKVRRLDLPVPITAQLQSPAEFMAVVLAEVESQGKDLQARTTAMIALGLVPPGTDLARVTVATLATQAAAYYDHVTDKIHVVSSPASDEMLGILIAHELTHALQDRHFDLVRLLSPLDEDGQLNSDALTARRYVIEGDAMFAAILHGVYAKTGLTELHGHELQRVRRELDRFASMPLGQMAAALRSQTMMVAGADPALRRSLDAIDELPPAVLVPFLDPYLKGAVLALDVYARGGWAAVDALYRDPPTSTEQVLHAKARLLGSRDRPHRVTLPAFEGYELVASDVIGELLWTIYFETWGQSEKQPAGNWGGDRFAVLRTPDGELTTLIATVWDGPYDAILFADAYKASLGTRFPGEPINTRGARRWVVSEGNRVFVFDGRDAALLDRLVSATRFEQRR
jgi:hypothetical protein